MKKYDSVSIPVGRVERLEAAADAARAMLAALQRMVADLREQEETHMCGRMRIAQIADLNKAIVQAEAAGVKA